MFSRPLPVLLSILLLPASQLSAKAPFSADDDKRARGLVSKMTLEEKIGQLSQIMPKDTSDAASAARVRAGQVGSMLNVYQPDQLRYWQDIATKETRLKIPLIIGRDVIHGFRTILPIPLGQAASWNPALVEAGAAVAAREARSVGIHWTFSPMIDVTREPRWGRIAEGFGEDPFLTSAFGVAAIHGFQGDDLDSNKRIAACAKHFAGYGASESGREYNTTWIPDQLLWEMYLPSFKAASDAGAATFMSAFNDLNGVPSTGNRLLLHDILRKRWGFEGFVVSDWDSVKELAAHGIAADAREAALLSARAGVDMEMSSSCFAENLGQLVASGKIKETDIDAKVLAILRIKFALGLFENPYPEQDAIYPPPQTPEALATARSAAEESFVLLKNENASLPIKPNMKIALIGPLADQPYEQLGTWVFDGRKEDSVTPKTAFEDLAKKSGAKVRFSAGLAYSRDRSEKGFADAIAAAKDSDIIVFIGGEESILSGEARSRTDISLPGAQEQLIHALAETGKPLVLVVMAGRPLVMENILPEIDALIYAWHPGTMAGPALVDVLTGVVNPSGKLPITFPRSVGQVPIYYNQRNTGRPKDMSNYKPIDEIPVGQPQVSLGFTSYFLDESNEPRFAFGEGLSYTRFEYGTVRVGKSEVALGEPLEVSVDLSNTGDRTGAEVVQLYIKDIAASITRPLRELKGFQKITLTPGQTKTVNFTLTPELLSFPGPDGFPHIEAGQFEVFVGGNSKTGNQGNFQLVQALGKP
ncbi:MAG: beta-glucosidase BglX [Gloeobacteraceae cyanobacterium ES-bin-144]|nr:beta-glucosidase BglX [Verrucomicrobiales bacterium]